MDIKRKMGIINDLFRAHSSFHSHFLPFFLSIHVTPAHSLSSILSRAFFNFHPSLSSSSTSPLLGSLQASHNSSLSPYFPLYPARILSRGYGNLSLRVAPCHAMSCDPQHLSPGLPFSSLLVKERKKMAATSLIALLNS
jgi:hypothetical protein